MATYEYDAFGNLLRETGNLENPYRYAGYRYDVETELYYLQSQYYNPETGRFLTRDTFEGFENEQLSLNKYAYTHNNPVMNVDPDGYYRKRAPWKNRWWNSKWFVSNAINWAITVLIGGSIGGLSLYLRTLSKRYFAKRAKVIFSARIKRQLLRRGVSYRIASYVANATNVLFNVLMWAANPGERIFTYLDSRDRRPRNGYLNF